MENGNDIERALIKLKNNSGKYKRFENYYGGKQDLQFATPKFENAFAKIFNEFALNMIPVVVDAPKDNLVVTEFTAEEGSEETANLAWKLWKQNRLDSRSELVHKEALKKGDGYVIVWVDGEQKTTIYPQKAENMAVFYDEETPGKIAWAVKVWNISDTSPKAKPNDTKTRLNLYYADRIERYISKKATNALPDKSSAFEPFTPEGSSDHIIKNEYGIVPVFHFPNSPDIANEGSCEAFNAIPIQDALNKTVCDMLIASEFSSYKQRYATGIEIEYDEAGNAKAPFMAGIERLWVSESPEVKFGEFTETDLKQFVDIKESFKNDIASVTGTPLHFFMHTTGQVPSGESYRRSESRFISKVKLKQSTFGQTWADVMEFALLIEGKNGSKLFTNWVEVGELSEKEMLENLILKKALGVDEQTLFTEAGYGKDDVTKIIAANQAKADAVINGFNAGI
jgi:hypothetical protein